MESHMERTASTETWANGSPSSGPFPGKRKHAEGVEEDYMSFQPENGMQDIAEYCRQVRAYPLMQAVMPRTQTHLQGESEKAEFYPLPPELNQAVLSSLGVQPAQQQGHTAVDTHHPMARPAPFPNFPSQGLDEPSPVSSPGLLQPGTALNGHDYGMEMSNSLDSNNASEGMDEEVHTPTHASASHGPQCKSIPQLSVRHYGGTASQLWASCPDCGAFSKVHEDKPVILCYSP